jgi:preprotein translocase subunit SecE
MLQRQGQLGPDGQPVATARQPAKPPIRSGPRKRSNPISWLKEVRAELRKVNWPSKHEVRRYSTVVFFTLVVIMGYIFGLDYLFQESADFIFK